MKLHQRNKAQSDADTNHPRGFDRYSAEELASRATKTKLGSRAEGEKNEWSGERERNRPKKCGILMDQSGLVPTPLEPSDIDNTAALTKQKPREFAESRSGD